MSSPKDLYASKIEKANHKINEYKKLLLYLSLVRLLFFLLMFALPIILWEHYLIVAIFSSLLAFVLFLFVLKKFQSVSFSKQYQQNILTFFSHEIEALHHNFQHFEGGEEFINPDHANSFDLDVFGRNSVFQYLNRTVTRSGKTILAKMLMQPLTRVQAVLNRQKFIAEVADDLDWRIAFIALGKIYSENENENDLFSTWSKDTFCLKTESYVRILLVVLLAIAVLTLTYWIFTGISVFFILSCALQFVFWLIEKKNIGLIYQSFGKRIEILTKYSHLLNLIESRKWKSADAKGLLLNLKKGELPSTEIRKLKHIVDAFDNRNNIFGIILNVIIAWDIFCSYRILLWHRRNRSSLPRWSQALSFTDAIISLSNYAFNYPDHSYPVPVESSFTIEANRLGHPLIHAGKRVDNDFSFSVENNVIIITGANMAGKSTFLRALGVNMLLGMCGAPVCARNMQFKPVDVFSNMRTSDSLVDDESYFFAELKRIKTILDEMEQGREMLIILDEILKGTNSVDKLSGSQMLIRKLIKRNCHAVIATHDLKLTALETEFPVKVKNHCFEIEIENDEMHFDYTLRNGVTNTMNATFLMKKMGIID